MRNTIKALSRGIGPKGPQEGNIDNKESTQINNRTKQMLIKIIPETLLNQYDYIKHHNKAI
jgi:hypothetical protein